MVVVLSAVLVVMPALSWVYLSKGFEWRKAAMAELQDYGKIRSAAVIYPDGTKENRLKDKVCVLHVFGAMPLSRFSALASALEAEELLLWQAR